MNMEVKQEAISLDILHNLEIIEAAAWNEMYKAADKFTRRDCGMQLHHVNGASLSIISKIDVLAFNRVVGWGIKNTAAEEDINEFIKHYKKTAVPRFFVQVSPYAEPAEATGWLQHHGFEHHNNWVKLYRESGESPHPATDFKFKEVTKEDAKTFVSIVTEGFQWPEEVSDILIALIGRKSWYHVMAWEEEEPISTASFYWNNDYAWFCFASTLPGYRAKGAQTALISHLIDTATHAGCKHFFVETADEKAGCPSPSARNLMRMGFREIYKRPNYIYYNK